MNAQELWAHYEQVHKAHPNPSSIDKLDFYQQHRNNIIRHNGFNNPIASIIIPALNEADLIARALAGINSALSDEQQPISTIIVDNGSQDATKQIAYEFGAIVVDEPKRGVARARQAGLESLPKSVNYLLSTDADTVVSNGWVTAYMDALSTQIIFAYGEISYQHDFKFNRLEWVAFQAYKLIASFVHKTKPSALRIGMGGANCGYSRVAAIEVGGYNTSLITGEDTDLMNRISGKGPILRIPDAKVLTSNRRILSEQGLARHILRKIYCNFVYFTTGRWPSTSPRLNNDNRKNIFKSS